MGARKGVWGFPGPGFSPGSDCGRGLTGGGIGGGGGGRGSPIPGAVVARWFGGPVKKIGFSNSRCSR